jgi:hypothetical protein
MRQDQRGVPCTVTVNCVVLYFVRSNGSVLCMPHGRKRERRKKKERRKKRKKKRKRDARKKARREKDRDEIMFEEP